ncbi:LPD7 domain-containing protein [Pseudomonas corrugata]|uniref:LPD7 domain-containing protein n=1 Tax=Pseudomonas corrugata TaxID=47879 RepID=UPI0006D894BC|nr:LPD7 domain-containing protein [Pseudomonas corrugata]
MGSENIRRIIKDEDPVPEFSISGPEGDKKPPVTERIKLVFKRLDLETDEESKKELERVLEAHDLYTKKSRFSSTVHYLDKKTDKTVFVDTGKVIALRRTGITESGVKLALQMAQQRFGSTLTINGTAEFKSLVIEAAAKNNLDIHFTDRGMNERLAERRAELELERDSNKIASPDAPVLDTAEREANAEQSSAVDLSGSEVTKGTLVDHGSAPYMMDKNNDESYYVAVKTPGGIRTLWGAGLGELMKDGGYKQGQPIQITDKGSLPVMKMVKNKDTGARESKEVFRRVWEIDPEPVRDSASPAVATAPAATQPDIELKASPADAQPTTPAASVDAVEEGATGAPLQRLPGLGTDGEVRRINIVDQLDYVPTLVTAESADKSFIIARELTFREAMAGLTEAEIRSSSTVMEWRATDHAQWLVASSDNSPEGREFLASYMSDDFYRESFKETIEAIVNEPGISNEAMVALEPALEIAQSLVSEAERTSEVSVVVPQGEPDAPKASKATAPKAAKATAPKVPKAATPKAPKAPKAIKPSGITSTSKITAEKKSARAGRDAPAAATQNHSRENENPSVATAQIEEIHELEIES